MAACLITVSGTSGEVLLKYQIGVTNYEITTGIGTFYIEDTATSVTYTNISGDASASSLCLTVTNNPYKYYKLFWKGIDTLNYKVKSIILGATTYTLPDLDFPYSRITLAESINSLGLEDLKCTDYKTVTSTTSVSSVYREMSYIVRVIGNDIPELKVGNADLTGYINIIGTLSTYPVTGYVPVNICNSVTPL